MPTQITELPLAQLRPSTTDATGIYSPATNVIGVIKVIAICNVTAVATTYRLFLDIASNDYGEATALGYDHDIAANKTVLWEVYLPMKSASNFAVQTGTAGALTFTIFGYEVK
uniref:Uncharacterized protein n=1 Tax=viral metagenome TaxID=1070528 RepID=A0A6M3IL05_9ZZZZ